MNVLVAAENSEAQRSVLEALTTAFPEPEVTVVASEQALTAAATAPGIELAIVGYRLGWADGLDIVRELRQRLPQLPILMLTAHGSEDFAVEAFRFGVSDYLPQRRLDRLGKLAERLVLSAPPDVSLAPTNPRTGTTDRVACMANLIKVTRSILKHNDFRQATRLVLDAAKAVIGAEEGYLGLLTEDGRALQVLCVDGDIYTSWVSERRSGAQDEMPIGGPRQEVCRRREPVHSNDVTRAEWWDPRLEAPAIEQVLCVPLLADGEVLGFLELANSPLGFGDADVMVGTLFAELTVFALKHMQLGDSVFRLENKFSQFAQASPGGIILTDTSGRIVEWNQAEETITGIPASDVVGLPLWHERVFIVPPEDAEDGARDAAIRHLQSCLTTGELPSELKRGEHTILRSDGEKRRIRYTLFAVPADHHYGLGSITWDITHEVRTRETVEELAEALQRERDILSATLANTRAHLAYLDRDFNFVRVNATYAEGAGYSVEQLIGRNHFDLFPDAENEAIFTRVRDQRQPYNVRAKPFVFENALERGVTYWDWTLMPVLDRNGETSALVLSLMDVTERESATRRTLDHLEQMEQLVEVAQDMLAAQTVEGLLVQVVAAARQLTGAQMGYGIHGHDPETYLIVKADEYHVVSWQHLPSDPIQAAWGEFTSEPATVLSIPATQLRAFIADWQLPDSPEDAETMLGARLVGHYGQTCAVIFLMSTTHEAWVTAAPEIVLQLAGLASLGLQHIEAHIETTRRVAELDATISAIADGVVIYGPGGAIVRMNEAAQRIMAYTNGGQTGPPSTTGLVASEAPALSDGPRGVAEAGVTIDSAARDGTSLGQYYPVERALSGRTVPGYVSRVRNPETEDVMWISASAAPIWGPDHRQVGAIEVLTDITELHLYQDRLEAANVQLQRQAEELRHKAGELVVRNRELRLLDAVGRDLSETLDLNTVLDRVLDAIQQVVVLGVAAIWLVDRDDPNWLVRYALSGCEEDTVPRRMRGGGPEGILGPSSETKPGKSQFAPRYRVTRMYGDAPQTVLVLPLHPRGDLIGVIEICDDRGFRFDPQVTVLLGTVATWAAIAIENALLHREAQRTAVASERSRLAGELHDAVSQLLFSAKVTAESLTRLWDTNPQAVKNGLHQLQNLTEGALAEMRTLLLELRPSALVETDMDELLRQLVRAMSSRSKLSIEVDLEAGERLPGDVQIGLYRIAQEALNNVMKHARAAHAGVVMARQEQCVSLVVWDDGRGFEPSSVSPSSLGLRILQERAAGIGASLKVASEIDGGTKVSVWWCDTGVNHRFVRQGEEG